MDIPPDITHEEWREFWEGYDQFVESQPEGPLYHESADGMQALATEHRTDAEAARLRDAGRDYEAFLEQAARRVPANDNKEKYRGPER